MEPNRKTKAELIELINTLQKDIKIISDQSKKESIRQGREILALRSRNNSLNLRIEKHLEKRNWLGRLFFRDI